MKSRGMKWLIVRGRKMMEQHRWMDVLIECGWRMIVLLGWVKSWRKRGWKKME